MKLLSSNRQNDYHEIEVERTYLWVLKVITKYRKLNDGNIMIYQEPNKYFSTGITEYYDVKPLFQIIL